MSNQTLDVSAMAEHDFSGTCEPSRFTPAIAPLPGFCYIADQWMDEPRVIVVVDQWDEHQVTTCALDAFVYHQIPDTTAAKSRWVCVAPMFVADVLRYSMRPGGAIRRVSTANLDAGGSFKNPSLRTLPELDAVTLVAYLNIDVDDYDDEFAFAAEEVAEIAVRTGRPWREVLEFIGDLASYDAYEIIAMLEVAHAT